MFDTAFVMIDAQAKPFLIVPEPLPEGAAFIRIIEGGIDIGVGTTVYGAIRTMEDSTLALLGMQDSIAMASFEGRDGEAMPHQAQYIARVHDTRF
jgi:hypothetical protein